MKLQKRLELEDKNLKKRAKTFFQMYMHDISIIIQKYQGLAISDLALILSHNQNMPSYKIVLQSHWRNIIRQRIQGIFDDCANEIETYWDSKRKKIDILTRVGNVYIARKVSPPWKKQVLNLKKPLRLDDRYNPTNGHIKYRFDSMISKIMAQLQRGGLNEESDTQILKRIKNMFNTKTLARAREANSGLYGDTQVNGPQESDTYSQSDLVGPIQIDSGYFSPTDIEALKSEMVDANDFEHRQYRPWFSEELRKNNRELAQFEQDLLTDAVNLIHSGQTEQMPALNGIEDMRWKVQRPGVCDCCDKRDGLTMTEIKAKIHDEFGDQPPRLHPNCNCDLVPVVQNKWKPSDLTKEGVEWNPETGDLNVPEAVQKRLRTDISLDSFIDQLSQGGFQ